MGLCLILPCSDTSIASWLEQYLIRVFTYTECHRRKIIILGGHSIGHSKQKCGYRVSQEERSIFWELIISVILNKKKCICTCVLFLTVSEIELFHCTLYRRATRHVLTRVAKCIDVDGGKYIMLGKLYQLCHLNSKYRH
jgi:hypothetical protein